jgi:peptidoglycan-N-acetylglucosamine deacetylase
MKIKLLAIILLFGFQAHAQTREPVRKMAVTIDDLPYIVIDNPAYLATAQRGTKDILRALRKYHAPAVGFVNEGKLWSPRERKARIALLKSWVDAGMILGNHTYSHPDFNRLTVEQFEDEIVRGDIITRRLMKSRGPYQLYFRHPMTHTGDTKEKKEAIERFLAARGYKVTPHTIENSDFVFNVGYARALRAKDLALAKRIRDAYLDFTIAATEFAEKASPQIFGREVPQILLIHTNDLNADCLDELLRRFAARGYRFITLDEAMADPAYHTRDTVVSKWGPSWLWRWAQSMKISLNAAEDPEPPKWVTDLYNQR